MIACVFEHIQWRRALNDFTAHGQASRCPSVPSHRSCCHRASPWISASSCWQTKLVSTTGAWQCRGLHPVQATFLAPLHTHHSLCLSVWSLHLMWGCGRLIVCVRAMGRDLVLQSNDPAKSVLHLPLKLEATEGTAAPIMQADPQVGFFLANSGNKLSRWIFHSLHVLHSTSYTGRGGCSQSMQITLQEGASEERAIRIWNQGHADLHVEHVSVEHTSFIDREGREHGAIPWAKVRSRSYELSRASS
jgi:hypothetical protein